MIPSFTAALPATFSPASRVWVYQADRTFTDAESDVVTDLLHYFVRSWRSHGAVVNGFAKIFFDQFIVLIADETDATVSGCSTDSSVRLIRDIQEQLSVGLFNRQQLAFIVDNEVVLIQLSALPGAVKEGRINPETLFFNNAVTTLGEMRNEWIVPSGKSWLQYRPAFAAAVR